MTIANLQSEKDCTKDKIKFKNKKVETREVRVGPNVTMCNYETCHK